MSAKQYTFSGPTSDGDLTSPSMSYTYERGYIALIFYSDEALTTVVTPTAGLATVTVSEIGAIFGSILNGVITASNVGPSVAYTRPNWYGSTRELKLSLSGILGAAYVKCIISRFGS